MQFGIYLVESGVISHEQFFDTLKRQLRSRPQIGALAIEGRLLSFRQVFAILRAQCDAPEDRFGELAVKLGLLTQEEFAGLLYDQATRLQPFSELLVESGVLAADEVEQQSRRFRGTVEMANEVELAALTGVRATQLA